MYCNNCGKNEPEIKLNNKLYCSHCGMPLEEPQIVNNNTKQEENKETADKNELKTAFSEMQKSLDKNEGGSYRSDNIKVIPRIVREENEIEDENEKTSTTVADELVPLKPETSIDNEKTRDLPVIKASKEKLEVPLPPPEAEAEKDKNLEAPSDIQINQTEDSDADPNSKKQKSVETSISEKINNNPKNLEKATKKVDELSAATKLIDILEDDVKQKEIETEIIKTRKMGNAFTKLIDILNQPVPSPSPIKHEAHKKKKTHDPIHIAFESLMAQKEITSPLDELEIEPPKEKTEQGELEIPTPQSISENESLETPVPNAINENNESEKLEIPIPNKPREENLEIPLPTPPTINNLEIPSPNYKDNKEKDTSEIIEENPEIPVSSESKTPETFEEITTEPVHINLGKKWSFKKTKKEPSKKKLEKSEEKEEEIPEEKVDLDSIKKEIHALGDKSGHIDHWPEEEVINTSPQEIETEDKNHPLTAFMKEIVEQKTEAKAKEKKHKNDKKKRNAIKIISAFIISFLILGGVLFIVRSSPQEKTIDPTEIIKSATFNISLPSYISPGYIMTTTPQLSDDNIILIYTYSPDKNQTITLTEKKIDKNFILENYVKDKQGNFSKNISGERTYYKINENEITWTVNDIWYTIDKTGNINIDELKKIAESIK